MGTGPSGFRDVDRLRLEFFDERQLQVAVLPTEVGGAVRADFHGELLSGPDPFGLLLGDLVTPVLEAQRVVLAHDAAEGGSEEALEGGSLGQRPVAIPRLGGLHREALVPEGDPDLFEKAVRLFDGPDSGDPPILISLMSRSWAVPKSRSTRPLA